MEYEQLKLDNQLCFPVYAASRLITREYQPHLDRLGITYPQYLVLLVLWETDQITVNEISRKLILNTNTVTPLLKRMEAQGIIRRDRSGSDERKVIVALTDQGKQMKVRASEIPAKLLAGLSTGTMEVSNLLILRDLLNQMINILRDKSPEETPEPSDRR